MDVMAPRCDPRSRLLADDEVFDAGLGSQLWIAVGTVGAEHGIAWTKGLIARSSVAPLRFGSRRERRAPPRSATVRMDSFHLERPRVIFNP